MDVKKLQTQGLELEPDRKEDAQISHGLNLVLKLKDPEKMPQLLLAIGLARRKIDAGLGELDFVHFARFLPIADGSALQVITEFDGPLEPYVLDFAIEIGDVFDMLLSYTQGAEKLVPIADHPAEFLEFVKQNNSVPAALFPPRPALPEWPLYCAHPDLSVLDIVGPRTDLPIPKADRWASEVTREDVQGNILKGYRAERARHFLLEVTDRAAARQWLAKKATPGDLSVTSSTHWNKGGEPDLMLNIGLTYAGMQALGIRDAWLRPFGQAFTQGALERAAGNFDVGINAPVNWWLGGDDQAPRIHVMVSLYGRPGKQLEFDTASQGLVASWLPAAPSGLRLIAQHDAMANGGKSWFGFVDGIANPRLATACPAPDADAADDLQPAASPGEFVLGAGYKNVYGGSSLGALPEELATNGSFCAVRVLAQNVKRFEAALADQAGKSGVDPEWLAAKLMGRWRKGAPVSLHPQTCPLDPAEQRRNDFDYAPSYEYPDTEMDHAGSLCPVGAHVRRANPRSSRVAGARYTRRLMRRGLNYDRTTSDGKREVGLFGMFVCADLERQFEFIQRQWINGDRFAPGLRGTRDPFGGTRTDADRDFEIPMADGPALKVRLPQVVETKGSLYLFMPGLKALRSLERFASEDPPAARPMMAAAPATDPDLDALLEFAKVAAAAAAAAANAPQPASQGSTPPMSAHELHGVARMVIGEPHVARRSATVRRPAASLSNLHFDPRRRAFQIDPDPIYAAFRAQDPVHYSPLFDGWFVFGYEDVVAVCTQDDDFSATPPNSPLPQGLFTLDPPAHTTVRDKVQTAWDEAIGDVPAWVDRSIKKTLDALDLGACFDLVEDFARPLPRDIYFDFLGGAGIEPAKRLELDVLARKAMKCHDRMLDELQQLEGSAAAYQLAKQLGAMLQGALVQESPYKGSFLACLAPKVDWTAPQGPFNVPTAVTTLASLTVAGYMSVEFLLATGIRQLLLDDRKGWRRITREPASLGAHLAELRRLTPALSVIDRFAKRDLVLGGARIAQGTRIFGVLASANRDEAIFGADADVFDPDRRLTQRPLGLGWGTHECMGRALEASITGPAIAALAAKMPGLRLRSQAQPPWFANFYFHSFDHLAVIPK